jgi:squalene-hopene/tetraprenyl-beta-curcumene cyclase
MKRRAATALILALSAKFICSHAHGDEPAKPDQAAFQLAVSQSIEFLATHGQAKDGTYSKQLGPGVTALVTMGLLKHGRGIDDPQVAKSLKFLEGCVQENGSITMPKPGTTHYDTSICLECFSLANKKNGRYQKIIDGAVNFLKGAQREEGEGRKPSDVDYGGLSYTTKTPGSDLSNTHMMMDAWEAAGLDPNDPAVQRALIFVSRCQNLESQYNTLPFAAKVNDGGFYYSPNGEGYGAAGKDENGALRSYASMTYAGLKSMLYAGLTKDDPRVKAALKWLQKNYSIDENPGLGSAGQYYYYHLMAKALDAAGSPTFEDAAGTKHDWRTELAAALITRQKPNGSWVNENNRWYESDPNLSTSFALLALAYCQPEKK